MTTEPKNKGGRPTKPADERLEQRSVRMTRAQWAKVDAAGGQPWLRSVVDQAPEPAKKKPAK